jgi:hypothetical protein
MLARPVLECLKIQMGHSNEMHLFQTHVDIDFFIVSVCVTISKAGQVAERSKACTVFTRWKLGSWVQIPHKTWMFGVCMHLFCVCVVLCLGRGLATS